MLATALYLSKFEHHCVLIIGNQNETFRHYANQLNIPYGTLRNYRDRFDRYVNNHRQGWNAPLTSELQSHLDRYGEFDEGSLRAFINN